MKKIFPYLTYAGAIPFIVCAMCLYVGIQELPLLGSVEKILSIYGLVISSFLAGAHWGQHLSMDKGQWSRWLPILSNAVAIVLWLGFLAFSFKMQMVLFIGAFVVLWMIDYRIFQADVITRHYFQTRLFVTIIVIISLVIAYMSAN